MIIYLASRLTEFHENYLATYYGFVDRSFRYDAAADFYRAAGLKKKRSGL